MKTILFYGNCQVGAFYHALSPDLGSLGFHSIYVPSCVVPGIPERALEPAELASCVLVLEQIDQKRFAYPEHLLASCKRLRFASLDTNLLWPFAAFNPYNEPGPTDLGEKPYGDRILLRCIDKGMAAEAIVDYYLTRYKEYRVDLKRVEQLDRARRRGREATADIAMADLVDDLFDVKLFVSNRHPAPVLVNRQVRRLAAAASATFPEFSALDRDRSESELFPIGIDWPAVPIHPGVAAELGLRWYDANAGYLQSDGSLVTHEAYVRAFVEHAIAARHEQRRPEAVDWYDAIGFKPPIEGAAVVVGRVRGVYIDAFSAPTADFEIEATAGLSAITVEAYYPAQHRSAGTVVVAVADSRASTVAQPGTMINLRIDCDLAPLERARVSIACSETLNMFELGDSDDDRDLGVLILKLRGEER